MGLKELKLTRFQQIFHIFSNDNDNDKLFSGMTAQPYNVSSYFQLGPLLEVVIIANL